MVCKRHLSEQSNSMTSPATTLTRQRRAHGESAVSERLTAKLYHRVEGILRENILGGRLPPGFVLLEMPFAEMLRTSRAPVQRALRMLEAEGLVHRFDGRGYLVGPARDDTVPLRRDIRDFDLILPDVAETAERGRASWERIYSEVEMAVASCLIFGEFRIVEAEIADHFSVSRTVVRDVLGRLHERGLIRKNQSSHWVAGPLTAQAIRQRYELRRLLEPRALVAAAPHIDRSHLLQMRNRLVAAEGAVPDRDMIDTIEHDLHVRCVLAVPNEYVADAIRQNNLPLLAMQQLLRVLGLPSEPAVIVEHRLIVEFLLQRTADAAIAAGAALDAHLAASSRRNISRLKIVAVIPEPEIIAPYLTRNDR
jgi:DNA-binding GntR family transcriptional regulator